MAIYCAAPDCKHNNMKHICKFFQFPLNLKIRKKWINAARIESKLPKCSRLCSCHFQDGIKENGPTYFSFNANKKFTILYPSLIPKKQPKKVEKLHKEVPHTKIPQTGQIMEASDCGSVPLETSSSNIILEAEITLLSAELENLRLQLKSASSRMTFDGICNSDALILLYTGIPTKELFNTLNTLIEDLEISYYMKWRVTKLSRKDQLFLTLMKLRQNFSHADLAHRFQISNATVTNIVVTFISVLHTVLFQDFMKEIPPRRKNLSCLPNCASNFTNCRIILDATEIFCAVPRQSMQNQRITYSSYKHRNTFKTLIGVAPNGVITFVSNLYGGSTSDKEIVQSSGILTQLVAGDLVLADKGFLIQEMLPPGVNLNIPPFLTTPQFTPEQVRLTQTIARARIHVERAIRRLKIFKILSLIPEPLFSYASNIVQVVGALTNFQYPLIREVSHLFGDSGE